MKMSGSVGSLGIILGIWAHPDDEIFSMGGIIAAAIANGQEVICITATRGEAGVQDESRWPRSRLADIRTKESEDAYRILGINKHIWLDYPDGGCAEVDEQEAVNRIVKIINKYQPDTVMTFGPDGMTGHPDHKAVCRWSNLALEQSGSDAALYYAAQTTKQYSAALELDRELDIFFNIDRPEVYDCEDCECCFRLDDNSYGVKLAALQAMPSQTERMIVNYGHKLRAVFGTEAFRRAAPPS